MIKGTGRFEYCKKIIANNPLFSSVNDETMSLLLENLTYKKWEKDTEFIETTTVHQKFHIILSGRVKIFQTNFETGRELTVFLLVKNDVFDVVSLLDLKQRTTNFKALDDTEVLSAPIDLVREWIETHPQINKTLLPYLGHRMRMLEENLTDVVLSDIPTRLAKLILKNIDESSKQLQLINDLSHDEIANLIGSTRAVVNRHLQDLKDEGILDIGRKKTTVLNLEKLLDKIEKNI